ncbi:MAG TPA: wax ester/triacylglycerol synthase family O-acyltransferase [Acidimicrobiales bacterium]|nr:wax ester/triacylglycerol synthase family O-acyltransferase [Acidimicrobiales bacterium]
MKRLNGTDALFLSLETPSWHQHVGGLTILETEGSRFSFEALVERIEERLDFAPKFRWKLREVPGNLDRPVWVDDPNFDVRQHVRRVAVPSPGGAKETAELAGTLLGIQLDRRRPLWELWLLEGLAGGRVALLMKYHHCLLDGIAGASLATALLDLEPDPPPRTPPEADTSAGPDPSDLELLAGAARRMVGSPRRNLRFAMSLARRGVTIVDRMVRQPANRQLLQAPVTPFNGTVGPRRSLAFSSVALADVHALKQCHQVKVNDVILALVAGALRSYLLGLGQLPDAPLVSAVPVSTRAEGNTAQDNQVSSMLVSLATHLDDPVARLREIYDSSQSSKEMLQAVRARQIQSIGEVAAPVLISSVIRAAYSTNLMTRMPLRVNTLVSNVPGPPVPIYASGARVLGIYPCSIILEGMGVNTTVLSYCDRVDFGVHVDPDLVPDPWAIADAVPDALRELMKESNLGDPTPVEDPFGGTR